jgi:hypothetical protein
VSGFCKAINPFYSTPTVWYQHCIYVTRKLCARRRGHLRIETESRGRRTTIRLIGHFQSEHVEELARQIQRHGPRVVLDLEELTMVDVKFVRSLGSCELTGAKIVNCSQYVREWIDRERKFEEIG